MITSFKHKGLAELSDTKKSGKLPKPLHARIIRMIDALHDARAATDMNVPGWNFHALQGKPQRYTVHVNGPWCITFEFDGNDASHVDFEQYH